MGKMYFTLVVGWKNATPNVVMKMPPLHKAKNIIGIIPLALTSGIGIQAP